MSKQTTSGDTTGRAIYGLQQLAPTEELMLENLRKQIAFDIRCCCPAIITKIDYLECTVSAQPVIKEKITQGDQNTQEFQLPEISDVPLIYLSSNGFKMTFPIQEGDECLLFFADTCIDSWWQSGGIQSQYEERRHDLSDCFCLPCQMSQVKKPYVSSDNFVLTKEENKIEITANGTINIHAVNDINLNAGNNINISAEKNIQLTAERIDFN